MKPLPPLDIDRLRKVVADLSFIAEQSGENAGPDDLRRASVDLHKLLIEDHFHQCWRMLQLANAATIPSRIADEPHDGAVVASAMHAQSAAGTLGSSRQYRGPMPNLERLSAVMPPAPTFALPLHSWLDSAIMWVEGMKIKRSHIIKYEALKRGGKHFDTKRRKKEDQAFILLDDLVAGKYTGGMRMRYFGHGETEDEIENSLKDMASLALLSIAQEVSGSDDVRKFTNEAKQILSRGRL